MNWGDECAGLDRVRFFLLQSIWEFPKIRGTIFWGPYNKDPTF